jgi:hypothetical protein
VRVPRKGHEAGGDDEQKSRAENNGHEKRLRR